MRQWRPSDAEIGRLQATNCHHFRPRSVSITSSSPSFVQKYWRSFGKWFFRTRKIRVWECGCSMLSKTRIWKHWAATLSYSDDYLFSLILGPARSPLPHQVRRTPKILIPKIFTFIWKMILQNQKNQSLRVWLLNAFKDQIMEVLSSHTLILWWLSTLAHYSFSLSVARFFLPELDFFKGLANARLIFFAKFRLLF